MISKEIIHIKTIPEGGMSVEVLKSGLSLEEYFRNYHRTDFSQGGDASLVGYIEKDGENLSLHGTVETILKAFCARCGESLTYDIKKDFDLILMPKEVAQHSSAEKELKPEDFSMYFYSEQEVNLGGILFEQLELAVPYRFLCKADCKGICPRCKVNLNLADCQCVNNNIDPRFSVLKEFQPKVD